MKKILFVFLLLYAASMVANGQIVEPPKPSQSQPKCKTCGKSVKDCNYSGNHPKTVSPAPQQRPAASAFTVNGSSKDIEWNNIPSSGGKRSFTVSTNDRRGWSLSSGGQLWIHLEKNGNNSFSITVDENKVQRARGGTVTVNVGERQIRITMNQEAGSNRSKTTYLTVNNNNAAVQNLNCSDASGCTSLFTVQTDSSDFTIWGLPTWCSLVSKTNTTFTIKIQANTSTVERNDYFKVKAGAKEVTIRVKQAGAPPAKERRSHQHAYNYLAGLSFGYTNMIISNTNVSGEFVWGNADKRIGGFQAGFHLQRGYIDLYGLGWYTGFFYNRYHSSVGDGVHTSFKESAVVLPVHAYYCMRLPFDDFSLWVHTGPDFGYFFGARYHDNTDQYRDWSPSYDGLGWYNHFNFSYSLNFGLQYNCFLLDMGFTWGISNHKIYNIFSGGTTTNINQFTIKLSYLFKD